MKIYSNGNMIEAGCGGVTMEQVDEAIDAKLDAYTPLDVYSTEEQRIGTWIDGKPLYRRVVEGTTGSGDGQHTVLPGILSSDTEMKIMIGTLIDRHGTAIHSGYYSGSSGYRFNLLYLSGNLYDNIGGDGFYNRPFIALLEYTKTTDKATIELPALLANISDDVTPIQTTATTSVEFKNEEV